MSFARHQFPDIRSPRFKPSVLWDQPGACSETQPYYVHPAGFPKTSLPEYDIAYLLHGSLKQYLSPFHHTLLGRVADRPQHRPAGCRVRFKGLAGAVSTRASIPCDQSASVAVIKSAQANQPFKTSTAVHKHPCATTAWCQPVVSSSHNTSIRAGTSNPHSGKTSCQTASLPPKSTSPAIPRLSQPLRCIPHTTTLAECAGASFQKCRKQACNASGFSTVNAQPCIIRSCQCHFTRNLPCDTGIFPYVSLDFCGLYRTITDVAPPSYLPNSVLITFTGSYGRTPVFPSLKPQGRDQ